LKLERIHEKKRVTTVLRRCYDNEKHEESVTQECHLSKNSIARSEFMEKKRKNYPEKYINSFFRNQEKTAMEKTL